MPRVIVKSNHFLFSFNHSILPAENVASLVNHSEQGTKLMLEFIPTMRRFLAGNIFWIRRCLHWYTNVSECWSQVKPGHMPSSTTKVPALCLKLFVKCLPCHGCGSWYLSLSLWGVMKHVREKMDWLKEPIPNPRRSSDRSPSRKPRHQHHPYERHQSYERRPTWQEYDEYKDFQVSWRHHVASHASACFRDFFKFCFSHVTKDWRHFRYARDDSRDRRRWAVGRCHVRQQCDVGRFTVRCRTCHVRQQCDVGRQTSDGVWHVECFGQGSRTQQFNVKLVKSLLNPEFERAVLSLKELFWVWKSCFGARICWEPWPRGIGGKHRLLLPFLYRLFTAHGSSIASQNASTGISRVQAAHWQISAQSNWKHLSLIHTCQASRDKCSMATTTFSSVAWPLLPLQG